MRREVGVEGLGVEGMEARVGVVEVGGLEGSGTGVLVVGVEVGSGTGVLVGVEEGEGKMQGFISTMKVDSDSRLLSHHRTRRTP